jgi:hypothetical protein
MHANGILFTRTVAPPLPESATNRGGMWIWEYNKENTGLLDAPYRLAYRLQLCIVIFSK